jgi:putative dehydrogenase
VFYASGPDAARFAVLRDHGLDIRVLDGPVSAASALKMSYGGITKGMTAIGTAMILAATHGGSAKALLEELQASFPPMPWMTRQVPGMYHRAYRWVAEMEEVSDFVGDDAAAREIYRGIAHLYERIARDYAADRHETAALSAFFKPDAK